MPGIIHITDERALDALKGEASLLVIEFGKSFHQTPPKLEALSHEYPTVTFCKVDVDKLAQLAQDLDIGTLPTFHLIRGTSGEKVAELKGSDEQKLRRLIEVHAARPSASTDSMIVPIEAPVAIDSPRAPSVHPSELNVPDIVDEEGGGEWSPASCQSAYEQGRLDTVSIRSEDMRNASFAEHEGEKMLDAAKLSRPPSQASNISYFPEDNDFHSKYKRMKLLLNEKERELKTLRQAARRERQALSSAGGVSQSFDDVSSMPRDGSARGDHAFQPSKSRRSSKIEEGVKWLGSKLSSSTIMIQTLIEKHKDFLQPMHRMAILLAICGTAVTVPVVLYVLREQWALG
ncbi:unnamed protein product [Vitrella brassicaformis CCMP3155]|uniref:Thioredoxin domain-containing protein n=1 Tax=Vitrella brassicaformis (strain CCMP3155) TaxID=1169540 RepID=A0A0G4FXF3_VITBC|nr:unnamed protein product [Vitrella brassicaformis CCMP3155]|mmetsp:Transcript_44717/g.111202  ORF Transcript_44717/g.111202 Transcript_44717/m.111202 type:complete len:346 (-) Transcript_44717:596-1633(-)|eukprot:CEM20087.1 unnamed protein product [Vitrella brassicaformis CCMP3155]